jgi:hypothetical protein
MSTITAEDVFRLYEQANNDFNVQLISKLYADISCLQTHNVFRR